MKLCLVESVRLLATEPFSQLNLLTEPSRLKETDR